MELLGERKTLLILILFGVIVRFSVVLALDYPPRSDSVAYMRMATSMLETGNMNDGLDNVAFYSSGYSLLLVPFFAAFGANPDVAQLVNAALGVISILLVYLCVKEIVPNWKFAAGAALIWTTYPVAALYVEYVAKENLMVFLLLAQTLILLRYPNSSRPISLAMLLGIVYGASLLGGAAIILTGAVIGWVLLQGGTERFGSRGFHWKPVLGCIFGCALILTPWLSYTNAKLGAPVLNTNGSFNLYLGNNANSGVHYIGIQDTPMGPEWLALREAKGELQAMAILKEKALDYIFEKPSKFISLALRKVAYFWTPPLHEGKRGNKSTVETGVRIVWAIYYFGIVLLGLTPLFFWKSLNRQHLILYSTVVLYCLVHGFAYVIFRYRLPIMPVMTVLSACGLHFLYLYWKHRKSSATVKLEIF